MSTNRLYCAFHAPTRTLLRVSRTRYVLQLLREGVLVASHRGVAGVVSWSRDGLVIFDYGRNRIHVSNPTVVVTSSNRGRRQPVVHPDGQWLYSASAEGLWLASIEDPASERLAAPFAGAEPKRIDPSRLGPGVPAPLPREALDYPEVMFGEDGQTWIALAAGAAAIGHGEKTLAVVHAADSIAFYPPMASFDLERRRILISGPKGLLALTLEGDVAAIYRDRAAASPAMAWKDDLLVVTSIVRPDIMHPVGEFEVLRLDPESLSMRGPLEGMPVHRDGDACKGLLVLPDGSVALVPGDGPVMILPSGETAPIPATPFVAHAGVERPPAVPHPEEPWYDRSLGSEGEMTLPELDAAAPGQRRSLARFLLEVAAHDTRFGALAAFDPHAFAPYREVVLAWDDERLERLALMGYFWFEIVRGASDAAVEALARRIEAATDRWNQARLMQLLLGTDTPSALAHAARLARAGPDLLKVARQCCVWVPPEGPAVRRFHAERRQVIVATGRGASRKRTSPGRPRAPRPATGVSALSSPAKILMDARGWICHAPPVDVLTLELAGLGISELAGSALPVQRFLLSGCEEECDEWMMRYVLAPSSPGAARVWIQGELAGTERAEGDDVCPGDGPRLPRAPRFRLEGPRLWRDEKVAGVIGGRPEWLQQPEPPDCPRCERLMFYVASTHPSRWLGIVPDSRLFGFHCEDCGLSAQVEQCT